MISNARLHGRGVAAAVLAAVAPGGIPTLGLQDCSMTAAAFEGCAAYLAATTRLVVYRCFGVGPSLTLAPPLGDIVSQTPQLRNLQVVCAATGSPSSSLFAGAPREIAGLRQLKTLQLVGAYLPHLEGVLEGLPDLSILDVQFNRLRRLPAALSRCTKLETLLLDGNMFLQLGATDSTPLKNVLASLPALKRLKLPGAPAAGVTISDLPDDLLSLDFGSLVKHTDIAQGAVLTEVCKPWYSVFYSSGDVWRRMKWQSGHELVYEPRLRAFVHLFQRMGPSIESLTLGGPQTYNTLENQCIPYYLSMLSPTALTQRRADRLALNAAAVQELAAFSRLTDLSIAEDLGEPSHESLAAAITQLPQLRRVRLQQVFMSRQVVGAVCRLPRLQSAELRSNSSPLPSLDALTALAGSLTELILAECKSEPAGLQLPLAAAFPKLEHLLVSAPRMQVPGSGRLAANPAAAGEVKEQAADPQQPPSAFDRAACRTAYRELLRAAPAVEMRSTAGSVLVEVQNAWMLAEPGLLGALLDAVVPIGGSVTSLSLRLCAFEAATFQGCEAHLAGTTRLAAMPCTGSAAQQPLRPALNALLRQAPALRDLSVWMGWHKPWSSRLDTGPPSALAALTHLTSLQLVGTSLPHVKRVLRGMTGLVHLDLRGNKLQRLPPSLSRCTQLTALLLGVNDEQLMQERNLRRLAALPALACLQLPFLFPGPASDHLIREREAAVRAVLAAAAPHTREVAFVGLTYGAELFLPRQYRWHVQRTSDGRSEASEQHAPARPEARRPPPPAAAGTGTSGGCAASSQCTMNDLPDEILGTILVKWDLGGGCLAVIEEVSRGSGLRMDLAAALPKLQRITFGSPKLQVPSSDILVAAAFKCSAAQLAAAQRLVVQGCRGSGAQGTLGAAIGAILQQTPRLRSLDITCTEGSRCKGSTGLLPLVGKLCHLTSLELVNTGLHSLAGVLEGLPGLVHLDLRGNKLQRVPPSLSRCTQLTALLLSGNSQQRGLGTSSIRQAGSGSKWRPRHHDRRPSPAVVRAMRERAEAADPQIHQRRQPLEAGHSHYYATCHPGLEEVVAAELRGEKIGAANVHPGKAGVSFSGPAAVGYRANLWLRAAIRVLQLEHETLLNARQPAGEAVYDAFREAADWARLLEPGQSFSLEGRVWSCSNLSSSQLLRVRARDAICDAIRDARGTKPAPPERGSVADLPLFVTAYHDRLTIYRDMSGDSLHRRGYRQAMHRASLNESAAAGILYLSGWGELCGREGAVLADPMCGSGTFLIEAALMATGTAPGSFRRWWPFMQWRDSYDRSAWAAEVEAAAAERHRPPAGVECWGNDLHQGALSLALKDVEAAGMQPMIRLHKGECRDWRLPRPPTLVVSNPPWGQRLLNPDREDSFSRGDESDLEAWWQSEEGPPQRQQPRQQRPDAAAAEQLAATWWDLSAFLKQQAPGATAFLLSGNPDATKGLRLKAERRYPITVGGVDCRLLRYSIRGREQPAEAAAGGESGSSGSSSGGV
ncbi:RNA methylase [Chlorella sorokiniana]|uniref:RNA methylase n=1 Tax=Chlorella sorokiniana TaxID=3076 RepID=A0A2P6U080_CHLSO|nr:RNA methylase [Chlorella sorokiniana]|eukprot:PRW59721.1 RNA methylase [Chlorella sorokiniana]